MASFWKNMCTGFGAIGLSLISMSPTPGWSQAAVITSPPVLQSLDAETAARKINLAGRQRMLSQRMAKASCFLTQGFHKGYHHQQIVKAHALFAETHHALVFGSNSPSLPAETHPEVLAAMKIVDDLWEHFAPEIEDVIRDYTVPNEELIDIAYSSQRLLVAMNDAVNIIARINATGGMSADLAKAINVSGRQRTLSQKTALEVCMAASGLEKDVFLDRLAGTFKAFDSAHEQLSFGDPSAGLPKPPNEQIAHQLYEVNLVWVPVKAAVQSFVASSEIEPDQVEYIAYVNDVLLDDLNTTVGYYAEAAK